LLLVNNQQLLSHATDVIRVDTKLHNAGTLKRLNAITGKIGHLLKYAALSKWRNRLIQWKHSVQIQSLSFTSGILLQQEFLVKLHLTLMGNSHNGN